MPDPRGKSRYIGTMRSAKIIVATPAIEITRTIRKGRKPRQPRRAGWCEIRAFGLHCQISDEVFGFHDVML